MMKLFNQFFMQNALFQYYLTNFLGYLANVRCKKIKNNLISLFIHHYKVNMNESAIKDFHDFVNFNDFFTRQLDPMARSIDANPNHLISPADGIISAAGHIQYNQLLQAKGAYFSLSDLLGGDEKLEKQFHNGRFITIYLAPKDYHRVHLPFAGSLRKMIYVPGTLYSVNPFSVVNIPSLFARNERVICYFETALGPLCVILIGALIVGSIVTAWGGKTKRLKQNTVVETTYADNFLHLQTGAEVGYFQLGSTVIVLTPSNVEWLPECIANAPLKMGQPIATSLITI